MSQAKAEFTAAQRDLADKRSRYTDQHPDVVAAVQKVQHATAKLERARLAAQTTADANPYADGAPRSKEDISAELARVQAQLAARRSGQAGASTAAAPAAAPGTGIVALETEWVSLNRAVGAARDRHGQLQDRLFSATMLASAESTGNAHRLVVLDPPYRPTRPAARGPRTVAVVSFALLLMAGIAAAIVKAALDRTLREELDLKRLRFCTLRHVVPASAGASEATS
jgi:hypothetical protein